MKTKKKIATATKPQREDCPVCEGTGYMFPHCPTCEGAGWVPDPSDGGTKTCPDCDAATCDNCNP
jgi:DnaJ-class molecular chaperone